MKMSNNTFWKILSMLTMTYRERKRVCPLLAHPLKPGIVFLLHHQHRHCQQPIEEKGDDDAEHLDL